MILYGLKTCDSCRKALKSLNDTQFVDVRTQGVPDDILALALSRFGGDLLNRRSTTWRGLSEAERAADPLALLADHPTLMKRPLIETGGRLFLGWDSHVQKALLG